jgi:hypothetical protein
MLHILHALIHIAGIDYGVRYGLWVWYNMWSGIGGSFLTSILTSSFLAFIIWWRGFSCHQSPWCFRHGRYAMSGGTFKACWKHHPDHGRKLTWEEKLRHHEDWKTTQPASAAQ